MPAAHDERALTASEFFSRAQERLTFDVPAGFADPTVIPRHDQEDADPAVVAAIAAVRPIRLAAVLVPIIERGVEEPQTRESKLERAHPKSLRDPVRRS
jgi:hypothetical protein